MYSVFSQYYDILTENVEYSKRADYFLELMKKLDHEPGLVLDLACGTGSLTLELFRRGIDIYGVDASVPMLSQAKEKAVDADADILFLCQRMQDLDLYGTVDTTICALDSINHLPDFKDVVKTFEKVFTFTNPGGYFIFDLNTVYKHRYVLSNNTYVYDTEDVYCVWQNRLMNDDRVKIELDFFERIGKTYRRSSESFFERAYPLDMVIKALKDTGFTDVRVFSELSFTEPKEDAQRVIFAAGKSK